jgi:glycosyltransferase involved in cell wall biosynthesis
MEEKKLRLNWHSNAPWTSVGYGNQTRIFTPRIAALGYPLSITAFYGLQGGMGNYNGIRVYPCGKHPYGQDVIGASAVFDGANAIITLMDAWVVQPENIPARIGWYPWYPVDCEPMPRMVLEKVKQARKGITMSKFGWRMAQNMGLESHYVPHGVETKVFRPTDMGDARKRLGWAQDKFVVGMVAANKGNPPRKSFFEHIAAFAALHKTHPDTMLYLHTDDGLHGGETVDLVEYCRVMGLTVGYVNGDELAGNVDVAFCDQFTQVLGLPDSYMIDVYNGMDVMMLASMGEGFGIPLIEAQACGCPVITGDWTAMGELCFAGWKIDKREADMTWNSWMGMFQWRVKVGALIERLLTAYDFKGNRDYRSRARDGALQYDADKVTEKYWTPVLKDIEENLEPASRFEEAVTA